MLAGRGFRSHDRRWTRSTLFVPLFLFASALGAAAQSANHPPVALPPAAQPTAVAFDASTDELSRTTNLPPITSFTMMGWFRLTGDNHAYSTLMGLAHSTSSNAYLVMMCCGNGWDSLALWTGSGFWSGGSLPLGTWHHLAISVAGSGPGQVSVYLDGVLNITADGNPAVTSELLSIANDSHGDWASADASSVKIYNAALSAGEIAQEMNQFSPVRRTSLNAWYPLFSAADATTDYSGNGRTLAASGTLTSVSGPPAASGVLTTNQNTALSGQLLATDADGDPLTYALVTAPSLGTVSVNASTGAFVYTPNTNATGFDSFTFLANDGQANSNVAAVPLVIKPVNQPPVVSNGTNAVNSGASVSGLVNATDLDSPTLTYRVITNGTKGTAVVNPATGQYVYTANMVASGTDTFTVVANDGQVDSNVGTITITITPVNHPPTASPIQSAPPSAVAIKGPSGEFLRTTNLPPITSYTMMGWFKITADTHAYSTMLALSTPTSSNAYLAMLCCGNGWDQLTLWTGTGLYGGPTVQVGVWNHVAITVSGSGPGQVHVYLNGALAIVGDGNPAVTSERLSIGNDSHDEWMDGNASSVKVFDTALSAAEIVQEMTQFAPVRTANLNSWYPMLTPSDAANDYSGQHRTLSVIGTPTAVTGPSAPVPSLVTLENVPLTGQLAGSDVDGDPITFAVVSNGSLGTVTITNPVTGAFVYTPARYANGFDTFSFKVNDGLLDSNIETVSVMITPVNQPPVVSDTSAAVNSGFSVSGTIVATDIDSPRLTYQLVSNGTKGTATVDATTGNWVYTANPTAGGLDTFTVKANDGQLDSNVGTITVSITRVNHAPVALPPGPVTTSIAYHQTADELVRTTNLPPLSGYTMMGWFRVNGDANSYSTFLALSQMTSSNGYVVDMCCGNGWDQLGLWTGNAYTLGSNLKLGAWNHIAITVSGTGTGHVQVYLNGVLNIVGDTNPAITGDRMSFGNDAHGEWLNGNAASVKVYDAALTPAEIAAEMTQFTPVRVAGLNGWYPLVSGSDAATDYSGNNRPMTATGAITTAAAGAPVSNGTLVTVQGVPLNGQLQAIDIDADPLTYRIVSNGSLGTVTITDPSTGAFTYTPKPGAVGRDTIMFVANDGSIDSNVGSLTILVTRQ